ncbi:hypothetical protein ACN9ML_30530 [Dyadobacter endophyticus]|uniref:hypothetical protein n=1 Tax=Dyadobacter endophyticus TaxID=1749036 RepID=UPI003CF1F07D
MTESARFILEMLESRQIDVFLESFLPDQSVYYGDVPTHVYFDQFLRTKELLIHTIKTGAFDEKLTFVTRRGIADAFSQAQASLNSIARLTPTLDGINRDIMMSGLAINSLSSEELESISRDLNALKSRARDIDKAYASAANTLSDIHQARQQYENFIDKSEKFEEESSKFQESFQKKYLEISSHTSQADNLLKSIKEVESEIDTKRLSISSFGTNIDEYKDAIESIQVKATQIVDKGPTIDGLISQAETALQLREAQGISAAFANQYDTANNRFGLYGWIVGGAVCLVAAVVFTSMLLKDTTPLPKKDSIAILASYPWLIIVGRAVMVSIFLSAAAFAARQYTKQKNLAEDYAYKAALSKSIVAFTAEIKKHDEASVPEYLKKILDEIHQDPLRNKLTKSDGLSTWDLRSFTERIAELVAGNKS